MPQTEAVITIFIPSLFDDPKEICEQTLGINHDGPLYGNKILLDDGEDFVLLVSDRELSQEEAGAFYEDIMEYHQEELSDEESIVRDEEVKTKWLNGNFNWWCIGAGQKDQI